MSICLANSLLTHSPSLAEYLVSGTTSLSLYSFSKVKFLNRESNLFREHVLVLQGYFLASSRELTRLDSITKAPVIHHFSESISGVMTIRSFRKQGSFCDDNLKRVNANLRMDFHNNGSNEWLGFRLELLGSFILCLSALFMILLPSSIIKPGITSTPFPIICFTLFTLKTQNF